MEEDDDVGLMWYRARWYDPETGRFVSEDPIGFSAGDANLNRCVGNSPANGTDPSGKSWIKKVRVVLTASGHLVFKNGKKLKLRNWAFRGRSIGADDLAEASLQSSAMEHVDDARSVQEAVHSSSWFDGWFDWLDILRGKF